MAEDLGELRWRVRADTDDIERARGEMDKLGDKARGAGKDGKKLGKDIDAAGRKVKNSTRQMSSGFDSAARSMRNLAAGVIGIEAARRALVSTVRVAADFDKSMAQVRAITRSTDEEFARLSKTARTLGGTTEFSASQAASALRFLGMAGFSAAESMEAVPEVLNLATAAAMDLGRAADISSNVMSAFGIAAKDVSQITDVLAAASSRANTDVGQLGEAMKFVGPVASALKISIGDTAAAIGVLSDAGIQGSAAGTGLRRVLSSLANPTKQATDTLAEMGLTVGELDPATNSLTEIIDRLSASGISAADALTIFGDRGGPAILALVENNPRLAELTQQMSNVEGEATRMADTMRDTLMGDFQNLGSAAQELQLSFMETFGGDVRGSVQGVTGAVRGLSGSLETLGQASVVLAATYTSSFIPALVSVTAKSVAHSRALAVNSLSALESAKSDAVKAASTNALAAADLKAVQAAAARTPGFVLNASAMKALTAAETQATTASNAYAAAQTRVAAAQTAHAAATSKTIAVTTAFRGVLGLVGGPIGATILSVGALVLAYTRLRDRIDETREAMRRLNSVDIGSTESTLIDTARKMSELNSAIEENKEIMASTFEGTASYRRAEAQVMILQQQMGGLKEEFDETTTRLIALKDSQEEANRATGDAIVVMDAHVQAMEAAQAAYDALDKEQKKNRLSAAELIRELEIQNTAIQMTSRSAAIFQSVMKASNDGVLPEQVARIAELTAQQWDLNAAIQGVEAQTKESAKGRTQAEEDAARVSQDNWQRTHEFVTTTILDIADNGGSAFERLGDVAVETAKRIAAEFLALKAMDLFGFSAPSGALAGGGFGGGGTGSLVNAGLNAAGVVTGAGAGGFSLGAVGTTTGGWVAPSMANPATLSAAGGGGGMMSSMTGFLTSPAGIAAMVAIGGKLIHDATNDPDGRHRGMGGMLVAPTPGAPAGSQFQVSPFASGFAPTGFADGPVSQQTAEQLIEQFRFIDQTIVDAVTAAGGTVAAPGTLAGFGLEGTGAGTFFGRSDITTDAQFQAQINAYGRQIAAHVDGLDEATRAQLEQAQTVEEIVSILDLVSVEAGDVADALSESADVAEQAAARIKAQEMQAAHQALSDTLTAKSSGGGGGFSASLDTGDGFGKATSPAERSLMFLRGLTGNKTLDFAGARALSNSMGLGDTVRGPNELFLAKRRYADGRFGVDGSHKGGLDRVPFDGYLSELHEGERVLTKQQASGMDASGGLDSDMGQLMRAMVRQAARTAKILERWEGGGLPAER